MKAAVLEKLGTTPRFQDFEDPAPEKDDYQIINVKAAPLKNLDKMMTKESFYASYSDLPTIVGTDGVGILEDGTQIYAQGITGMMAEKAVIPKDRYTILPDHLDFATASALPNAVQGAAMPLRLKADIQKDDTVLINGATGFTGQLAVQVAQYYGAGNIIATGRAEDRLEELKLLGADTTISLTQSDEAVSRQLKEILNNTPIDIVIDYLWGHPIELMIAALKDAGPHYVRIVSVGNMAGDNISLATNALRSSAIELLGSGLGSYTKDEFQQLTSELLPEMFQLAAKEKLSVNTREESLENIEMVWDQDLEAGERLVITIPT